MKRTWVLGMKEPARLRVENIELSFGGVSALNNVSLDIKVGEILAIIGPNGAGKTCILNCINGFYRPQKGRILLNDEDITRLPRYKIAELGISRTFQSIQLYSGMSTQDNLMAARHILLKPSLFWGSIYFGPEHSKEIKHREVVEGIIDFLELESARKIPVGTLPYGQRKRVDLGRALAIEPRVLLLDEPMAGMNLDEKEDMTRFILDVHELAGIPIVLVEHDMGVIMDIADRIIALDYGRKIAEGIPEEIKTNDRVIKAYLGEEE